ncbi:S1 family peptidase [Chachezhania sediminis]|uniref:S1 family peptidase n=1 Tax=Chachezhania sediminis TaxID=2599291 RepID=UPI00131DDBBE|nr:serine protease [Chachezhania sediminis]
MADNFLTKNRIDLGQCLPFGDGLALDAYPALAEALKARVGPEAARLFAEPLLSRGNDNVAPSVSWYSDVPGTGQPFGRLPAAAQSGVTETLSARLKEIEPLVHDPEVGSLVAAAFHVKDPDDIWVVGGQPVLLNWGMLPAGMACDPASRTVHYGRTLGRFLPLSVAPPLTEAERDETGPIDAGTAAPRAAVAAGVAGATAASTRSAAAQDAPKAAPPTPPPLPPRERLGVPVGAWVPLVILLLLAGGFLAWLMIPGNRIFPEHRAGFSDPEEAVILSEQVNRTLEERVQTLRAALDGAMCLRDGTLLMPDGVTIEGLLPPNDLDPATGPGMIQDARVPSLVPPGAERTQVASAGGATTSLLDHIERRTAMVLVQGAGGLSVGTGFFVGPDLLVTNYHVVENAGEGGIYVTNPALASLKPAELLKALGPLPATGGDFALLRVEGANQPAFQIHSAQASQRLQSVIAAGYPGDLLKTDSQFRALRSGNLDAVPNLAVTDGTISAEQQMGIGSEVLVHSAPISTGNSGGPLIDMCGRLIGVNTFVVQGPLRNLNFALSGADLVDFLEGTPAVPTVVTSQCAPRVKRAVAQADAADDVPADLPPLALPKIKD